jgi:hypothetical protein
VLLIDRLKNYKHMFMLLKFGLLEEYESFKKLSEIRVANRYKETSEPKAKEKRKVSESTRRGSETSGEEKIKEKEDLNAKGEEVMKGMMKDLEKHAKEERKRIIDLLNVRKHAEMYSKGFHNNAAIAQKLQ